MGQQKRVERKQGKGDGKLTETVQYEKKSSHLHGFLGIITFNALHI